MKSIYTAGKTVLASSIFLGMAFGTAHAETCYKLGSFIDVIRLAETTFQDEAPAGTHRLVVGNWTAGGSYSLPLVGSRDLSVNPVGVRIGLHGTNHTVFFGNHSDCTLDAIIPGGPVIGCCDGKVPGFFCGPSVPLNVVSCDSVGPSVAVSGKAYGQ